MSAAGQLLSSFAHLALLPPASLFLTMAIGVLLGKRWKRLGRVITHGAIVVLFLLCTKLGSHLLVSPLERMAVPLTDVRNTNAQAIVVLAAGRYENAPEYDHQEIPDYVALARLRYAARLHRETGLPILVSGSNASADGTLRPKAIAMAEALEKDFGVPVRWREPDSENTAENARYSARILKAENLTRILLVTDAMHMPRSVKLFEQAGMDTVPAPTIFFSSTAAAPELTDLLPTAENLRRSYYAVYEWLGLLRDGIVTTRKRGEAL